MLSHSEAQALISASLDTPLDEDIDQILSDHLAGCAECRMFAASSQRLSSALGALPTIPPSPAVRQGVWAGIDAPPPWWTRIGGAISGQTAAIASTAAIALLVIAFAVLAILRITGGDDGDDDATRLAAGTQEAIALATEVAEAPGTVAPTVAPTATEPAPTATASAPTATQPAETEPASTATTEPVATEPTTAETPTAAPETVAPTEPDDTPVDLTGDGAEPTAEPTTTPAVAAALFEATARAAPTETAIPTETPVPPTSTPVPTETPEPTETPVPTETPQPTETPEPQPADLTVTLVNQDEEPIEDACFALIQDGTTVSESCDTADWETAEFASNGNTGFFDVPAGTYTLRLTSQPDGVEVEEREVELEPGSEPIVTISAEVATPTAAPTETPLPTETPEPTQTPVPPTETPELPTETPRPTQTPAPTATPMPTETPAPTETEEATSPPIEPIDGQAVQVEDAPEATSSADDAPVGQIISPAEATAAVGEEPVPTATESTEEIADLTDAAEKTPVASEEEDGPTPTPTETGEQVIEPIEGDGTSAAEVTEEVETAIAETETPTADGTGGAGYDLSDAPFFSDGEPWGDINARLAWQDGQVAFTESPDGSSLDNELLSVQTATEGDSQYLEICSDAGCSEATLESGEGSFSDEPIGWLGDTRLIYQRSTGGGEVEIRELIWNGGVASDAQLGTASDPIAPLGRAYPVGAGTLIPGSGSWLLVSGNNASIIDDNPYGDIQLARTSFGEPLIAYVAGGQLIVAEQSAPGTAIATIPFNGVDFDLSPDTQSVVISTGSGLEIWSLGGELLGASDGSISTGSVLWLSGGIVFLDLTNGTIKLVDPARLTG